MNEKTNTANIVDGLSTITLHDTDGERMVFKNARVLGIKGGIVWIQTEERGEERVTLMSPLKTDGPRFTTQAYDVNTQGFNLSDVVDLHIDALEADTEDVDSLTSIDLSNAEIYFNEDGTLVPEAAGVFA